MRGIILSLALLLTSALSLSAHAQGGGQWDNSDVDPEMAAWLDTMDQAVMNRWEKMTAWQNDSSWINEKVKVGMTGTLYNSGWLGAQVSRNVIANSDGGWLVVDTLTIPMGLGLRVATFATNLFFMEEFPFIQVGVVKERSFIDVRVRKEYRDALLAPPFNLKKLPLNGGRLERMEVGETISTIDDGGFEVQGGVGLSTLLGADLAADRLVDIGLSGKFYFKKARQIDITRDGEATALILMRDARERSESVSAGLSISLQSAPGPVLIGVNSANGFVPVKVNAIRNDGHSTDEVYSFRLGEAGARETFDDFVKRDFTKMAAAIENPSSGVTRELLKQGTYGKTEKNVGMNLIVFRAGKRWIQSRSDFVSTLADGKSYAVGTRSLEKISENGSYRGAESTSRKYELIVPLNPEAKGSFVLDYVYRFADKDTQGKELAALIAELQGFLAPRVVFPSVDTSRSYGDIRAELTVRFTRKAVDVLFRSELAEGELWMAIGSAMGVTDPLQWSTAEGRSAWAIKQGSDGQKVADISSKVFAEFARVRSEADETRKMVALSHCDRDLKVKNLCLKTMIRLSDDHGLVIRGSIQGDKLGFAGNE